MKQPLRNYCLQNWHISHATSLCRDCWFFCPGCIHYVNMNQGLYLLFNYLCQGTASLEDCYFVSVGHNKPLVFSTSLCWRMYLMIFIWSETNGNGDTFFYLNFLTLVKSSKLTKLFNWKWFDLVFHLPILPTK